MLLYQIADVHAETRTVEGLSVPNLPRIGAHHLRAARMPMDFNLAVTSADLRATPATAQTGQPVTIQATIRNTGAAAVGAARVDLITVGVESQYGGEQVLGTQTIANLGGGKQQTVSFTANRPADAKRKYLVRVTATTPATETDDSDNEARLGVELAATPLYTQYLSEGALFRLQVSQSGAIPSTAPVSATLRLGSPDGPEVGKAEGAFAVDSTGPIVLESWVPASALGAGRQQLWWTLDPGNSIGEQNRDDNLAGTGAKVQADVTAVTELIGWNGTPGSTAPFSMVVRNDGIVPTAGAAGEVVEIFDGPPGQAGVRSLARLPLPALQPGEERTIAGTLSLAGLAGATEVTPTAAGTQPIYIKLDADSRIGEINENDSLVRVGGSLFGDTQPPPAPKHRVYVPLVRR
jgi:hypothetical protein